jgi:hypothetical protein
LHVGVDVHLDGFDGLIVEPEGDDSAIDAVLEGLHRRTMAQRMRCDAFLLQSRAFYGRRLHMSSHDLLDGVTGSR